ncbi:hypothetical protein AQS8620_00773 [Aquimixticola soesokkakensis]|uniref:YjiS-like domain-containing protein n=1 Tax=Aquimixticola soesokkakensis TaxID=1519096 RepID=A0A1Y5RV67_9RHOB|nr:DUF1127 domain-containing protein [Aquimixticola soesokkakensis]SLN26053.1 hypothetical protein AQS8620_00773 [Aquimixticola soesokkakensis]
MATLTQTATTTTGFATGFAGFSARFKAAFAQYRTLQAFNELSDRELADLGLTRATLRESVRAMC